MSGVVVTKPAAPLTLQGYSKEEIDLITATVAKGASPKELELFLYRCRIMELDPLKPGQIYFIKYGNNAGTIVVGIDGFRTRAARTKMLSGIRRGVIKNDKGVLTGAWAEVTRKDWSHPAREEVAFNEYTTEKGNWQDMPETMIKKVAEAAALRMAFPDELSGIYTDDEIAKVSMQPPRVGPEQPEEGDGDPDAIVSWKFAVSGFKGRTIEDAVSNFGREKVGEWYEMAEARMAKAKKEGKYIENEGDWRDALDKTREYLLALDGVAAPVENWDDDLSGDP